MDERPQYHIPKELADEVGEEIIRFWQVKEELDRQSDRGAAIIGSAYVDLFVANALKAKLMDYKLKKTTLFDRLFVGAQVPLASLSAKIDMAFALQLIGRHTYHDLHIIRDVRNKFAHNLDVGDSRVALTFMSDSIKDCCGNLWFPQNDYYAKNSKSFRDELHLDHPRGQYTFSVFQIANQLRIAIMEWQNFSRISKYLE